MKIELAKQYSDDIKKKVDEINQLMKHASMDGLTVSVDFYELTIMDNCVYPTITCNTSIDPTKID